MEQKIVELAKQWETKTITRRRDLHKYAESGWTEFRTAATVVNTLKKAGYQVFFGDDAVLESSMMGVPSKDILATHMQRAVAQGADPELVAHMAGGKTAVIGVMRFAKPGPVVALRFDMDCNDVPESSSPDHPPVKNGFSSVNPNCMHACGHDAHTSVGLGVAELLAELKDGLAGTVKLIFQPAEEGTRGAKAIVAKGFVDDVDFMLGAHVGAAPVGSIAYNVTGFLATSKFDAEFTGVPAHAGASPEVGKNALLAAASAALNIQAIPRHSQGVSRVNVGLLNAGTGRNVIPGNALLKIETRGQTTPIADFVKTAAFRILHGAAQMYDIDVKITEAGGAASGTNSPALVNRLTNIGAHLGIVNTVADEHPMKGSEDFSYYMERVQQNGKQAAFIVYGAATTAANHNSSFDIDESCMTKALHLLTASAVDLLTKPSM